MKATPTIVEYGVEIASDAMISPPDAETLELEAGHPGLGDEAYVRRREALFALCRRHRLENLGPPEISYTDEETRIWREVSPKLDALHVAHAEAEELCVYPTLRTKRAIDAHEQEHGEEEHAEGNQALLAVLELKGTDTQAFDDAVEELAGKVNHHLTEEELTILNPARTEVSDQVRAELGLAFVTERAAQLDADCGRVENVRAIVARAEKDGVLPADDEDD
jgi:hypothetical protein